MRLEFDVQGIPAEVQRRFWSKVAITDDCCRWTAAKARDGYGVFWLDGRQRPAHKVAFEWANGPVPPGMQIDHLCRTVDCVRPDNLEAVLPRENTMRGVGLSARNAKATACMHGHAFTPENTYRAPNGSRHCRECRRTLKRERRTQEDAKAKERSYAQERSHRPEVIQQRRRRRRERYAIDPAFREKSRAQARANYERRKGNTHED